MKPHRVIVVGGGIAGLAAAYSAHEAGAQVTLFERAAAVGGKATSHRQGDWMLEGGPTGVLGTHEVIETLIDRAAIRDQRVLADAAAARRFIVRGGVVREVIPRPFPFLRSGILSLPGALRLAAEPLVPKRLSRSDDAADESVWEFARRRIGTQAANRLIAPMVLGVFAGDARQLSLSAAFPRLAALEREHGGLVRGMLAKSRQARQRRRAGAPAGPAVGGPAGPGGALFSFREGMASLPLALAQRAPFALRVSSAVDELRREQNGWSVAVCGQQHRAEHVILAGEAWAMAPLLRQPAEELSRALEQIAYPPIVVVGLGYGLNETPRVPRGFGVLIPRGEGLRTLGCLWDSHLFPGRAGAKGLLLRAMLGGAVDPGVASLDDQALQALVRDELLRLFGISATPRFARVVRWDRAIPQYTIGHGKRIAAIQSACAAQPGLWLAGNAYRGVAFAKAAADGWLAGKAAAESPQI